MSQKPSRNIPALLPASEAVESVDVITSSAVVITEEAVVITEEAVAITEELVAITEEAAVITDEAVVVIRDEIFAMVVALLLNIADDVEVISSAVKFKGVPEMFKITITDMFI